MHAINVNLKGKVAVITGEAAFYAPRWRESLAGMA